MENDVTKNWEKIYTRAQRVVRMENKVIQTLDGVA